MGADEIACLRVWSVLFHSLDYLLFLPLTMAVFWGIPRRFRLGLLVAASFVFYASWRVAYLGLLVGIILLAWGLGQWMGRLADSGSPRRQAVKVAVIALLLPLLAFKYWNWLAGDLEWLLSTAGTVRSLPRVGWVLPVGISFFTFQAVAYVVDVRRGAKDERGLVSLAGFLSFFPQLVAGPIVRSHQLMPQLKAMPYLSRGDVGEGLYRIARGVAKKILIADTLRMGVVAPVFLEPASFTSVEILIALYAYTLQIYCDFSGYTDIAIGSARLFGIRLPENFNRPYKATSVAEFWRRWHITLSDWVRDYVYFGLGGSRMSAEWKVYRNILVTLLVIGLWHGASWNFVVYGLLHGSAVSVNRWRRKRREQSGSEVSGIWAWSWRFLLTFHFLVLARILFRCPDFPVAWEMFSGLFAMEAVLPRFSLFTWVVLGLGYGLHFLPEAWEERFQGFIVRGGPGLWALGCALLGAACVLFGSSELYAFVYYQF